MSNLNIDTYEQKVREAAAQAVSEFPDRKISAIKRMREIVMCSLLEAKQAVENAYAHAQLHSAELAAGNAVSLHDFAVTLLDAACPAQVDVREGDRYWNFYNVEVHCVRFEVIARKCDGVWEIRAVTSKA